MKKRRIAYRLLLISILIISCVLIAVISGQLSKFLNKPTYIEGTIIDSKTQNPLSGATVSVRNRGWGYNSRLVWDKDYIYTAVSNNDGYFKIFYKHGPSAHLQIYKRGHVQCDGWYEKNSTVRILLRNELTDNTHWDTCTGSK